MKELSEAEKLNIQKAGLISDLMATEVVMEELWRYHPDNPDRKDVTEEYDKLKKIKEEVELELEKLD